MDHADCKCICKMCLSGTGTDDSEPTENMLSGRTRLFKSIFRLNLVLAKINYVNKINNYARVCFVCFKTKALILEKLNFKHIYYFNGNENNCGY